MKKVSAIFLLFLSSITLRSQILPKEGGKLNYRIIGFSFPPVQSASHYIVQIAKGNHNTDDSFKKNIIITAETSIPRVISEVPHFGNEYTWRVVSIIRHASSPSTTFHHFSTVKIPAVDTSLTRLRMLNRSETLQDFYIFIDGHRGLYDMNGNAVWYVPLNDKLYAKNIDPRDLKLSPQGTVTLLVDDEGYEINYNADILWTAPDAAKENYHHEFTRLSNGNYMILGYEPVHIYLKKNPGPTESGLVIVPANGPESFSAKQNSQLHFLRNDQFSKVIEYGPKGNIVRKYTPSKYFSGSDLYFNKTSDGNIFTKVHNNGFYLDEKAGILYLSFKEINRIVKIKYPEGKIIDTYGDLFAPGAAQNKGKGLFCKQHHCSISSEGHLCVYNNNTCNSPLLPTVVIMQQPATIKDSVKKIWEFKCPINELKEEEKNKLNFTAGGSVYELPDHSLFVNMGGDYSKLFIVNRDKEILWSALIEKWQVELKKWLPFSTYRASIITRQQLEQLIWNQR